MGLWVVERPAAVWDANKKIQSLWKIKSVLPIKSLARKHELGNGRITLEDLDFFSLFLWFGTHSGTKVLLLIAAVLKGL